MDTILYKAGLWIQSYEGVYTLIILNCIVCIGWVVYKGGILNKEHLK
jgi:hypothetical protein